MPPTVKMAQSNRFNDPKDPCKILVATDAVGMGLNLSIRRMIFYSLMKPQMKEQDETDKKTADDMLANNYAFQGDANKKTLDFINTSQALQIAGRAGRLLISGDFQRTAFVSTLNRRLSKLKYWNICSLGFLSIFCIIND
jgi:ATP-dependent RNA helicase SUPV3L1/SUV3